MATQVSNIGQYKNTNTTTINMTKDNSQKSRDLRLKPRKSGTRRMCFYF